LSVACLQKERCVFSTGAGAGWIWDGQSGAIRPIPDGAIGGGLMALAGDGAGTIYFVAGGAGKQLAVARLSADGASWEPLFKIPVATEGVPIATFAALSPQGNLWIAVRDRVASGQEFGRGAIEVALPSGRAIHHQPYKENQPQPPEAIPVTGDVSAIKFHKGNSAEPDAIWFCTLSGVTKFAGGQLQHWSENEGMDSERCRDLEIDAEGNVWIATDAGPMHLSGDAWLRSGGPRNGQRPKRTAWPVDDDGEEIAARALVVFDQNLWVGTPRGLLSVGVAANSMNRTSGLIDDDVVDLATDRFGRLWVLGHIGLSIVSPGHALSP
jgi:ligand-binding sensor domain-containing protein